MDENKKKICPFCGAEINNGAKKCRFCNNWLDEEIKCPFCAETIKASAKKCRFCGEWLGENQKENENSEKENTKQKFDFKLTKKVKIILLASISSIILLSLILGIILHIPSCKSSNIQNRVKESLSSNYTDIGEIIFDKKSAHKLKRQEKGYSCSISATIDNTPTTIEYSYKKVSLSEYDISTKFVLPNCFDASVKTLLNDEIKKYDYYNIKNNTADVYTTNEAQNNYDKEGMSYSCTGTATLTSKPGKAYLLNSWDYDEATRTINCKVDYKTYFCKNGYTTCVDLNDLYSCEYKD